MHTWSSLGGRYALWRSVFTCYSCLSLLIRSPALMTFQLSPAFPFLDLFIPPFFCLTDPAWSLFSDSFIVTCALSAAETLHHCGPVTPIKLHPGCYSKATKSRPPLCWDVIRSASLHLFLHATFFFSVSSYILPLLLLCCNLSDILSSSPRTPLSPVLSSFSIGCML